MTQRLNERSGFTLLELLMVVIIIGILAALALPSYIRAVERSRTAEILTIQGQIKGAAQRYCAASSGTPAGSYADLDVEDPTVNTELASRWTVPGLSVTNCNPLTMSMTWTRSTGPCAGSTFAYSIPPAVAGADPWTTTWAAGSPCA